MFKCRLLLFPLLILTFYSCSNSVQEKDLVGSWKVSSVVDTLNGYSPEEIQQFEKWAYSLEWNISEDHTFMEKDIYDSIGHHGTWSLETESQLLNLTDDSFSDLPSKQYGVRKTESGKLIFDLPAPLASVIQVELESTKTP